MITFLTGILIGILITTLMIYIDQKKGDLSIRIIPLIGFGYFIEKYTEEIHGFNGRSIDFIIIFVKIQYSELY